MRNKSAKLIAVTAASIFIMSAPMTPGMPAVAADRNPGRTAVMVSGTEKQAAIDLAENTSNGPDDNKKANPDASSRQSEPISDSGSQPAGTKSKPLKPFVPSEKIPAGQAVDFPVDI